LTITIQQAVRISKFILMKMLIFVLAALMGCADAGRAGENPSSVAELQANGAFGFPHKDAKAIYDQPLLRFSVWNNSDYLFAQAVLWTDDDASLGKTDDNRKIGDWSELLLDLDGNGKPTPNVRRTWTETTC